MAWQAELPAPPGCGGEHGPKESLAFFAAVHQLDMEALVRELNAEMQNPSREEYVYRESLGDYIYRRFFKAGIIVVLLNVGCSGRVLLQVLTDFIPATAFPLVGLTGFIEVIALGWWGVELWHTMNLAHPHRSKLLGASLPVAVR